jgi:hypothetical protein
VVTPFDTEVRRSSLLWYVDSFGRTVVELSKKNIVDEHSQTFEVSCLPFSFFVLCLWGYRSCERMLTAWLKS